jgi:glycosyltransferase involved in cell wall biosynthesis
VFVDSSRCAWGTEQHFVDLARGCHEGGHRVIAVVRAGSDVATLLARAGVEVRTTPFRGGADPRALVKVWQAVREIGADWLVTDHQKHYWALYALARLTGARLAVFRHMAWLRGWLSKVLFTRLVDRFFVVSDFALEQLARDGAPRGRLTRLYNPIDLQRFRPDSEQRARTRAALGLPSDAFVVGFVGRHELGKGVHILRDALPTVMARDPRIHAVWVGHGPEWGATRAASVASGFADRHRFVDWTHHPEQYYVACDCLVAPSVAVETFGRVVSEAQACGVPVIASTVGGLAEAFEPGRSGHVVRGNDSTSLAQSVLSLVTDRPSHARMSEAGRNFVRRFELAGIADLFVTELSRAA